jgi:hypothetical protein
MDSDFDSVDVDFMTDEMVKRFDKLSSEDQEKFAKEFAKEAEENLEHFTFLCSDPDFDEDSFDFLDILRKTYSKLISKYEKDSWRGLNLLRDPEGGAGYW